MADLKYRYQLLKDKLAPVLEMIDHDTHQHIQITAREVVGCSDMLMGLHPLDIRLVCILAMREFYEQHQPELTQAANDISYEAVAS